MSKYNAGKLQKLARIKLPTASEPRAFQVPKVLMDKDMIWTVMLSLESYFETVATQYNLVFAPNPRYVQDNIDGIIRAYANPQQSIDDLDNDSDEDPVDKINSCIDRWNQSVKTIGIANMLGELESYKRKDSTKDISFVIGRDSVDFFKDRWSPSEGFAVMFEEATQEDGEKKFNIFSVEDFLMEPIDREAVLN